MASKRIDFVAKTIDSATPTIDGIVKTVFLGSKTLESPPQMNDGKASTIVNVLKTIVVVTMSIVDALKTIVVVSWLIVFVATTIKKNPVGPESVEP